VTLNPARLARFADWARTLPPRPLPRTATPVRGQYYLDYISRLADANHLELLELTEALDDPAAVILDPARRRQHQQERLAAAAGQPLARIARLYWGRRRPLPARPRRVPPAAAPGLPPLHGPPRHHRAHRLPPAAAPDRLPPPPALDRPGRPHPRRPARHRPAPRDPPGAAPPPRPAAHHPWQDVETTISAATQAIYQALRGGTWIPGQRQRLRPSKVLPPKLSHPRSAACPWLRSNGKGQS